MVNKARFHPSNEWLLSQRFKQGKFKDDFVLRLPEHEAILYLSRMHEHITADFIGLFVWDGYQYQFTKQGTVTGSTESEYLAQLQECYQMITT